MSERWVGIQVVGDKVTVVHAEVTADGVAKILEDLTWDLQQGDRPKAYQIIEERIKNYARENGISKAVIKGSAVSQGGTRLAHLQSAEVRGVVMAALATVADLQTLSKATVSKRFGDRKADEYLADDDFWNDRTSGTLRKGSREAALLILAAQP